MAKALKPPASCAISEEGMESPFNRREADDSYCDRDRGGRNAQPTIWWVFCCPGDAFHLVMNKANVPAAIIKREEYASQSGLKLNPP
jgi:hypothetical protein